MVTTYVLLAVLIASVAAKEISEADQARLLDSWNKYRGTIKAQNMNQLVVGQNVLEQANTWVQECTKNDKLVTGQITGMRKVMTVPDGKDIATSIFGYLKDKWEKNLVDYNPAIGCNDGKDCRLGFIAVYAKFVNGVIRLKACAKDGNTVAVVAAASPLPKALNRIFYEPGEACKSASCHSTEYKCNCDTNLCQRSLTDPGPDCSKLTSTSSTSTSTSSVTKTPISSTTKVITQSSTVKNRSNNLEAKPRFIISVILLALTWYCPRFV